MVLIYALMSGEEVLYVGRTIQTLEKRASEHRSAGNQAGSRNIPPDVEWEIKLLEECAENAAARERHYIETLKPLYNTIIPGTATETQKAYQKAYRQTEAGKEVRRKYFLKKECERLWKTGI